MPQKIRLIHDLRNLLIILDHQARKLDRLAEGAEPAPPSELSRVACRVGCVVQSAAQLLRDADEAFAGGVLPLEADKPSDVAALLRDAAPRLENLYEVALDVPPAEAGPFLVNASAATWRCIYENLVANAAQAGAKKISVAFEELPGIYRCVFRDDGRGMTEDEVRRLGLGFTTKVAESGGQGFRIVRGLMSQIGGTVSVTRSAPGMGTELALVLPKALDAELRPASEPQRLGGCS